jgi:hypothetical protein
MEDIKHTEKFTIDGNEIELLITRTKGLWECVIVNGYTGTGNRSGGKFATLKAYIDDCKRSHIYSYNFFNKGYAAANELNGR